MSAISNTMREAAEELLEEIESGTWHKLNPRMKEVAEDLQVLAEQLDMVAEEDERQAAEMRAMRQKG